MPSCKSVLRRLTLLLTLKSTDRSPKSTMMPPWMAGFTFCTILTLFPLLAYCEPLMAASRRDAVDLSRGCSSQALYEDHSTLLSSSSTHSSTRHNHLDLSPVSAHQLEVPINDLFRLSQPTVSSKNLEQVAANSKSVVIFSSSQTMLTE